MRFGAVTGGAKGFFFGFTTGEIFGGEVTFGTSGLAAGAGGAVIQGTLGATTGVFTGFLQAEACNAAGMYN